MLTLETLLGFPLPERWRAPELLADAVVADGLRLERAGAAVSDGAIQVTGSAADCVSSPVRRSLWELLERVSIVEALAGDRSTFPLLDERGSILGTVARGDVFAESDAPDVWRPARSNGVALHEDWPRACVRARSELAERDRVLRSWYGEICPAPIEIDLARTPLSRTSSYRWQAFRFPSCDASWSRDLEVAGVFGFPLLHEAPIVFGYAARASIDEALASARSEAMQQLAFLWGEVIPSDSLEVAPTALGHLEYWLSPAKHGSLEGWLRGEHVGVPHCMHMHTNDEPAAAGFVDLTPSWMTNGMRVAKAIVPAALPLLFGIAPGTAALPPLLRVHPIA